jgi:hypothetical protein
MASQPGPDTSRFAIYRDGASVVLEAISQMLALAQTSLGRWRLWWTKAESCIAKIAKFTLQIVK